MKEIVTTKTGNFRNSRDIVVSTKFELAVAMGLIDGHSYVGKFGENPDVDTGTTPEDVWEGGGTYTYDADASAPIQYLSSSNAGDTGQTINIHGLDINGDFVSQNVTTNGQNNVTLTTPLWRVFRMINNSAVGNDLAGTLYCHIDASPTAGAPAAGNERAIIDNGNNQTLMSIYTIPNGKVGFLYRGEIGMSRAASSGAAQASYLTRKLGKVFTVKRRMEIANTGSSIFQSELSFQDPIPGRTDMRVQVESVTANNTGIFANFEVLLVDETRFTDTFLASIGQPGY